jgi:hypothetical protein
MNTLNLPTSDEFEMITTLFHAYWPVFIALALWSLVWKGLALWHAGRRNEPKWFIVLLVVNTLGILEIVYLFAVCKLKLSELFQKR